MDKYLKKRKVLSDILFIMASFFLFTIWYQNFIYEDKTVPVANVSEPYKIYMIPHEMGSDFWKSANQGAADMAKLLGVEYILDVPENWSVDNQIEIINRAVENGADAMLVAALDPEAISSAITEAQSKGVKVIYIDSPATAEATSTLATDNYHAGQIAAETIISELEASGIRSGSIGILGLRPETITTEERDRGFKEAIIANGRYTMLDTVYTQADIELAEATAKEFIDSHEDLVGLFATHEEATIGLGNAIKESDSMVVGIGFDLTKTIQQMIREGYLQAVLVQNPYTQGYLGMAQAFAAVKGFATGPKFIDTGVSVVTQFTPRR
jgi:ribose transport system substrate-binding protein